LLGLKFSGASINQSDTDLCGTTSSEWNVLVSMSSGDASFPGSLFLLPLQLTRMRRRDGKEVVLGVSQVEEE